MGMDMKTLSAAFVGESGLVNVDPLVAMLNYRDKAMTLLLTGMLFQKAVLDWDMKSERGYADGPMVDMAEMVVNIYSRTESLPEKYHTTDLPTASEPGPFMYDPKRESDQIHRVVTPLQGRLITVLREMQSLQKGLRHMKFGTRVFLSEKESSGKQAASEELRKE